jgi:RNA polymerase sigma-70 factor (ECF subfamily)
MNPQELERVYEEHAGAMFRHGMTILGQEAAVRDILQDIFLKLAGKRDDHESTNASQAATQEKERPYLLRMVHYAAIDHLRRAKVRTDHATREAALAGIFQPTPDQHPDRLAHRKRLLEALASLPEDQREVVVLKLWEERTFAEIAGICAIPANTAASKYRYGLEKLRALLRPLYEEL